MVHLVVEQKASLLSCKKHTNEQRFVTLAATFSLSVCACVCACACVRACQACVSRVAPGPQRGEKERTSKTCGAQRAQKNEPLIQLHTLLHTNVHTHTHTHLSDGCKTSCTLKTKTIFLSHRENEQGYFLDSEHMEYKTLNSDKRLAYLKS